MSHLPTTPRSGLYCGTPYEQFQVQYLAADAGVGAVAHDAGDRILGVRVNRTALEARRLEAVIAAHREIRAASRSGYHPPSISPTRRQLIAAGLPFCSLQATTQHLQPMHCAHVEVKAVLLAGARRAIGHALTVTARRTGVHTQRAPP